MESTLFLMCASKLRRDTGDDLETVGMSAEFNGVSIDIYGDSDKGHELIISEFVIKDNEKWVSVEPTASQKSSLQAVLYAEVLKVTEIQNEAIERVWAQMERENEIEKYGREGAIYNSHY